MEIFIELEEKIEKLKSIFVYQKGILLYDEAKQNEVNKLLKEILEKSQTLKRNKFNERENIKEQLTIIDSNTGEKITLIDIPSMESRVDSVLDKNNIYSCLKALALTNKCAHSFDGSLDAVRDDIKKLYEEIGLQYSSENLSFMDSIDLVFPNQVSNTYNLDEISDNNLRKLCTTLFSNWKIQKQAKIASLKWLNKQYDVKNKSEDEINEDFEKLKNYKTFFLNQYVRRMYKKGQYLVSLQSKMFSVKNDYISMIAQLLKQDVFKNGVGHFELVKTIGFQQGYEHMLIIDDKELQYYIEVHMPDFIANALVQKYGYEVEERQTLRLGASAVYCRDETEINNILGAMNDNSITNRDGQTRAQIITRHYSMDDPVNSPDENTNSEENGDYSFITEEISAQNKLPLLPSYLVRTKQHLSDVQFNEDIQTNENYSVDYVMQLACRNYYNIYENFHKLNKLHFIVYSLTELESGDAFDKKIIQCIVNNYNKINDLNEDENIDLIGKLLINKDIIKKDFVFNNKYELNEIVNNENYNNINYNLEKIDKLIEEYLFTYIGDEKEKNSGFRR